MAKEGSTETGVFRLARTGGVAELTLARPEVHNAMNGAFWNELPGLIDALDESGATRALVLASTGRHFSAGMDLAVFSQGLDATSTARHREQFRRRILRLQDAFTRLEKARFPVIAAIQGGCIGGGVDLVCACDVRYATRDAYFCIQEINLGLMADVGTLQRLPRLLPEGVVRELAYTGMRLSSADAHRLGFVNEIFDDHDSLLDAARATARRIAARSPLAVSGSKEAITFARGHDTQLALEIAATWQAAMLDEADIAAHLGQRDGEGVEMGPLLPLPGKM